MSRAVADHVWEANTARRLTTQIELLADSDGCPVRRSSTLTDQRRRCGAGIKLAGQLPLGGCLRCRTALRVRAMKLPRPIRERPSIAANHSDQDPPAGSRVQVLTGGSTGPATTEGGPCLSDCSQCKRPARC